MTIWRLATQLYTKTQSTLLCFGKSIAEKKISNSYICQITTAFLFKFGDSWNLKSFTTQAKIIWHYLECLSSKKFLNIDCSYRCTIICVLSTVIDCMRTFILIDHGDYFYTFIGICHDVCTILSRKQYQQKYN